MKPIIAFKAPELQKTRKTERGELLRYFAERLKMPIPRVARHLGHLKELSDLYYLKSDCDQAAQRGVPFGAAFWTAIKPKSSYPQDKDCVKKDLPL